MKAEKNGTLRKRFDLFAGVSAAAIFFLLLISPNTAIDYMKKGLSLCVSSVVPSLFPFMIISELIVSCGMGQKISRVLSPFTKKLFGVGEAGACAFLLGTLCGFPVGARSAASMYDKGEISSRELGRILTFCNNPGPAFVISSVGVSLLHRQNLGMIIYACVIISSLIVGIFSRLFLKEEIGKALPFDDTRPPVMKGFDAQMFTSAVSSSAHSMLAVCAYVVFFSTVVGCVGELIEPIGAPKIISVLLFGFFELSSGAVNAAALDSLLLSSISCALFCGWSGLSVHFQVMSVTSGRGVSFKPYLLGKAAQGIICAVLSAFALKFIFPSVLSATEDVFWTPDMLFSINGGILTCGGFLLASLCPIILPAFSKKTTVRVKNLLDKHFSL